ncbi:MAG: SH3 domain-containing protein, partial [Aridibacter sp.]
MAGNFKKIEMNLRMLLKKLFIFSIILIGVSALSGCGIVNALTENIYSTIGLTGTGTVISGKVYIRSSYAVVAADLLEVKRGQQVEVLDETTFEKTLWYRVRAFDEDETEGWIEAQHIIKEDDLDKSRKFAEEDKTLQPQATGQLRATTNLRLTPEQKEDNILLQLDNGATFEIVDWQYVKTAQPEEKAPENEDIKAAEENKKDEPAKLDETYDIWYKVRLDPSVSPAPMGWIYGK